MLNNIYYLFLTRLFCFKGRSGRKEYIARSLLIIILIFLFTDKYRGQEEVTPLFAILNFCIALFLALYVLQYFPLAVRRLHDFNVNGWWILISFIPCGQLIILWFIFKKGTVGSNDYGELLDRYNENYSVKNNLLIFTGIVLSLFLLGFYLVSLREDKEYSLLAAKEALEYYKQENYEEALKGFEIAISFTPKEAFLYRAKGDTLLKLQRYEEAIQDYDKVIELNPTEIDVYNKKIFILFKQSNYEQALKICDLVSEKTNDKNHLIYVYIMKANILNKMALYKEALTYIEKVLSIDHNNKKAMTIKKHILQQLKAILR